MANIQVDLNSAEGFNVVKDQRGYWTTRPAFKTLYNEITGRKILYAFSTTSSAGEKYHYIITLRENSEVGFSLYSDQWISLGSRTLGTCRDPSAAVTHAVNYNQIIINSPGFNSPYWCFVGSMPRYAEPQPSIDPDQDTIDLFPGLVASFGESRTVWAYRNQIFINEAGTDPRVLTAVNLYSLSGTVYDMFTAPSGNLVIITSDGMYDIPADGLAGETVQGQLIRTENYFGLDYRNACTSRLGVYGLAPTGLIDLASTQVRPLTTFKRNRKITQPVGPGGASDFRTGKIFSTVDGVIVSYGENYPFCYINMDKNYISWWQEDDKKNDVVGILSAADGTQLLAFSDRIVAVYGDSPNCTCGIACEVPLDGFDSYRITDVVATVTGNGSGTVRSYLRNSDSTKSARITPGSSTAVTTSTPATAAINKWDTAKCFDTEFVSVRAQRAIRSDGLYFELGVTRDMSIQSVTISYAGQGRKRHR